MGTSDKFPALRRRVQYLEKRMNDSRKTGRQPLSFDVAEYAELQEVLRRIDRSVPRPRDARYDEPPVVREVRRTDGPPVYEEVFVPGEPRGSRYYGGQL